MSLEATAGVSNIMQSDKRTKPRHWTGKLQLCDLPAVLGIYMNTVNDDIWK